MFGGQGSQHYGMGHELRSAHPVFDRALREIADMFGDFGIPGLLDQIYRPGADPADPFDHLRYTHPAIAAIELAVFDMLTADGITPDYLVGYSLGETVAAAAAGVLDRERMVACVAEQALLVEQRCTPGAMLAVLGNVKDWYAPDDPQWTGTELAAVNFDRHFVVSGSPDAVARAGEPCRAAGITCTRLPVHYAFHSADMDVIAEPYRQLLSTIAPRRPRIPLLSSSMADFLTDPAPESLWRMFRGRIRFRDAMQLLESDHDGLRYIDLSPSGTLASFAARNFRPDSGARAIALLDRFAPAERGLAQVRALRPAVPAAAPPARTAATPTAVVFPGQGSQQLGMAEDLFAEFPELVSHADEILGYSVRRLCVEDPDGLLGRTEFTQPALFVANALYYRAWERDHPPADLFAGHSLGEYSALWAAGAFDFRTGLRLVQLRGALMSRATEGGMAAVVGLSADRVRDVLSHNGFDDLDIANINSADQLVVSGPRTTIERARERFQDAGARYLPLRVGGAFHSRYMAEASAEFGRYLAEVELAAPRVPVIANATAEPYPDTELRSLLTAQLTHPVRWADSVHTLLSRGAAIHEVGPGRVLTKLVAKIRETAPAHPPSTHGSPYAQQPETSTTAQPDSATAQPDSRTAQDVSGTAQPDSRTAQPGARTAQHDSRTAQPDSGTAQPITGTAPTAADRTRSRRSDRSAVAIVGIGCRLPGADSAREFLENLRSRIDSVREVPPDRWDPDEFYDADITAPNRSVSKWLGALDRPWAFDHEFFGISPREAALLDPQQRMLMEETYHCLEDAGITASTLAAAKTSVYLGNFERDHLIEMAADGQDVESHSVLGVYDCLLANRISQVFDLVGASFAVDAACASSLVAVHLGVQALTTGDADYVLAGGVNLSIHPWKYLGFAKARMLSPDGRCKAFDRDANGFVPGDGVGVVLLRRLDDAVRDGDHIYGVVTGTAVNHGGKRTTITAPTVAAERAVVADAIARAGISPREITYVETHGTGTALGDPIEVEALRQIFAPSAPDTHWCTLGSVKSNIGHLEGAAGVAGLIKVLMMMRTRRIVPTLHVRTANPLIDLADGPFRLAMEDTEWLPATPGAPLRAGVSSFGFGGVNSHVVVEEYQPEAATTAPPERTGRLPYLLSAASPGSLHRLVAAWQEAVAVDGWLDAPIEDICATLATGRAHLPYRLAGTIGDRSELRALLATAQAHSHIRDDRRWVLHAGVLAPPDEVDRLLAQPPWRDLLHEHGPAVRALLDDHRGPAAQCAFTALTIQALCRFGLEPDLIVGTGPGVWAALAAAGVLDLATAAACAAGERPETTMRTPTRPLAVPGTDRVLAPLTIDDRYLSELRACAGPDRWQLAGLLDFAAELVGQRTLRHNLRDWQNRLAARGLGHLDLGEKISAAAESARGPRESLVLALAVQNALDRLNRKWDLPLRRFLDEERCVELLDLLLDGVLDADELIEVLLGADLSAIAAAAQRNQHRVELSDPHRYPTLRRMSVLPGDLRTPQAWARLAEADPTYPIAPELSVVAVGAVPAHRAEVTVTEVSAGEPLTAPLLDLWRRGVDVRWDAHPVAAAGVRVPLPLTVFDRVEHRRPARRPAAATAPAVVHRDEQLLEVHAQWSVTEPVPALITSDRVLVVTADADLCRSRSGTAGLAHALVELGTARAATGDRTWAVSPADTAGWHQIFESMDERGEPLGAVVLDAAGLDDVTAVVLALVKAGYGRGISVLAVGRHQNGEIAPELAAVAGMARCLHRETDTVRLRALAAPDPFGADSTAEIVAAELNHADSADLVRYHAGRRESRIFRTTPAAAATSAPPTPWTAGTYLVTGGLGRIGRLVAAHVLTAPGTTVVLTGRTPQDRCDLTEFGAAAERITYLQADIADLDATTALVARIRAEYGPLTGVLHCAGTLRDGYLAHKSLDDLHAVLAPKVRGARNLDLTTRDDPLELFVLFSSVVAVTGNPGQGDYAAANAYLDEFASARSALVARGLRPGRTVSIGWPIWRDGGMSVTDRGALGRESGMRPMSTGTGLAVLDRICAEGSGPYAFLYGDPTRTPRLLDRDNLDSTRTASAADAPDPKPAAAPDPSATLGWARDYVATQIARLRGVSVASIDLEIGLDQLGLDSIVVSEFNARIERDLGTVSETLLFECRTLAAAARRVAEARPGELATYYGGAETVRTVPQPAPTPISAEPEIEAEDNDDIAIVGLACRYPMAPDLRTFWENLSSGRDCIGRVPATRWQRTAARTDYDWGGFLDDVDAFDPLFFNISPREAEAMDPQERLLLQTTWHACEDAGYPPRRLGDPDEPGGRSVGVFVGVTTQTYQLWGPELQRAGSDLIPLSNPWSVANRLSYFLNLHGPSMAVDTACASALSVLHLAAESIIRGECAMALAGGVNLYLHPAKYDWLAQLQMLSPTGRCHAFGAAADGFVPGEGIGVAVLKPLRAARADGDRIRGVIKGSALNHGGRTSGFTVPNPRAQAHLVTSALTRAGVDAATIGYVEAHGTGTALGDPIEIAGLTEAFAGTAPGACAIGSVKSNIGHLEAAAGMAALTKVLLQMQHGYLAPSLHSAEPNPRIRFADTPFRVVDAVRPWPRLRANGAELPRRAGISSFGAGGSNAHVIVEEAPADSLARGPRDGTHLLVFSAADPDRLRAHCRNVADEIRRSAGDLRLSELAYQLQVRREPLAERFALLAADPIELAARLTAFAEGSPPDDSWTTIRDRTAQDAARRELPAALARGDLPALAAVWVTGVDVPWETLYPAPLPQVELPGYPFATERYRLPEPAARSAHPFVTRRDNGCSTVEFTGGEPFLDHHRVDGTPIFPAAGYLEMVRATAVPGVAAGGPLRLRNNVWSAPITVTEPRTVRVELIEVAPDRTEYTVFGDQPGDGRTVHATGLIETSSTAIDPDERIDIEAIRQRCRNRLAGTDFYPEIADRGLRLGPMYQGIVSVHWTEDEALAQLRLPTVGDDDAYLLHPGLLDSAFQSSLWLLAQRSPHLHLPFSIGAIDILGPLPDVCYSHVVVRKSTTSGTKLSVHVVGESGRTVLRVTDMWLRPWQSAGRTADDDSGTYLRPAWVAAAAREHRDPGTVLVLAPTHTAADRLTGALTRALGRPVRTRCATPGTSFSELDGDHYTVDPHRDSDFDALLARGPVDTVLYLCPDRQPSDSAAESAIDRIDHGVLPLFGLLRALVRAEDKRRVRVLCAYPAAVPEYAALGGLLRTMARESARMSFVHLGLPGAEPDDLSEIVARESLCASDATEVRHSDGIREVLRWEPFQPEAGSVLRDNGIYLITGGAGGLGLLTARWLAETVAARIVLVGRSAPGEHVHAALRRIRAAGGAASYLRADVSTAAGAQAAVRHADLEFGGLHGIFHCAGVLADDYLLGQDAAKLRTAVAGKVLGAHHIDAATANRRLDFRCLFSSVASVLGSAGQAPYSYANGFLDHYAASRDRDGHRTIAINWPLWADGGMRVDAEVSEWLRSALDLHPLPTDLGLRALGAALASRESRVLFVPGDGAAVRRRLDGDGDRTPVVAEPPAAVSTDSVQEVLISEIAEIGKLAPARIRPDRAIGDYGFDSLMLGQLANRLVRRLAVDITPALFFEYTTVQDIAVHLMETFPGELAGIGARTGAAAERESAESESASPAGATAPITRPATGPEPIAIIGMHATLPGSPDPDTFWRNLFDGRDLVTEIPADRWDWREYYHPTPGPGRTNSKWGGFLPEVDTFDAKFFGISPKEARLMDPQQRLFLQTAYRTIEDAGYRPADLAEGRTGLFVGVGSHDYYDLLQEAGVPIEAYTTTGRFHAILANRVSYLLDLKGPSFPIDTACSSSLVALRSAIEALRAGSCDTALVGGVNLLLAPMVYISFARAGMLSPTGRCRTFDAAADGYVRAEGVGALLLKPLSAAERDGDHIHAVIRGSAVNHGGRVSTLTTPNPHAQAELIVRAFEEGGVDPATVGYMELHGTGTALGDPIEINGLRRAFRELRDRAELPRLTEPATLIGSVKSNIGHAEAAAGIAGICKVILAMKYGWIPANLHIDEINPQIRLDDSPFTIVRRGTEWPRPRGADGAELPRRAGISSFGFGGVNAHALLEEYLAEPDEHQPPADQLFVLSARSVEQLREYAGAVADRCETAGPPADIAFTLQAGRTAHPHRLAVVTDSAATLADRLRRFAATGAPGADSHYGIADEDADAVSGDEPHHLAARWVRGAAVDWPRLHRNRTPRRVSLPTCPFARERHWFQPPATEQRAPAARRLVTGPGTADEDGAVVFRACLASSDRLVQEHRVHGSAVVAGALQLELAAAAVAAHRPGPRRATDVCWLRPLTVPESGATVLIRLLEQGEDIVHEIRTVEHGATVTYSTGRWVPQRGEAPDTPAPDLDAIIENPSDTVASTAIYRDFAAIGIEYGPLFRSLRDAWVGAGELVAHYAADAAPDGLTFGFPPSVLDAALQAITVLDAASGTVTGTRLPFSVAAVELITAPPPTGYLHVRRHAAGHDVLILDTQRRVCVALREVVVRAQRDRLDGVFFRPYWTPEAAPADTPQPDGSCLIIHPPHTFGLDTALAARQTGPVWRIRTGTENRRLDERTWEIDPADPAGGLRDCLRAAGSVRHVWFLGGLLADDTAADDPGLVRRGAPLLFRTVRALAETDLIQQVESIRSVLNDAGDQAGRRIGNPAAAALTGLTKALAHEFPRIGLNCVDIGVPARWQPTRTELDELVDALRAEPARRHHRDLAFAGGRRLVRRLRPVDLRPSAHSPFRDGGNYLIIGGAGGLGLAVAEHLAATRSARLTLVGRGRQDQRIEQALARLVRLGGQAGYRSADVTDREAMRAVIAKAKTFGPLHGVVHAAMVLRDGIVERMSDEAFDAVLAPKVDGTRVLAEILADEQLDFLLVLSSVQTFTGSAGQANYAAASSGQDAFAQYLAATCGYPVHIVNSGPWAEVGRVADAGYRESLTSRGYRPLPPAEGIDAIERILGSGERQLAVLRAEPAVLDAIGVATACAVEPGSQAPVFDGDPAERQAMDEFVATALRHCFGRLGLFTQPYESYTRTELLERLGALPKYRRLVDALIRILARSGLVSERGELIVAGDATAAQTPRPALDPAALRADLVSRCLTALPDVLTGATPATDILFPGGSMAQVAAIYRNEPQAEYCNRIIAEQIARLSVSRPLRVLEIGAGTGATTECVLDALGAAGAAAEYEVTDISAALVRQVAARLHRTDIDLRFGQLDIERSAPEQGFAAGHYDIVLAANVVHATADLDAVLGEINRLLVPGGRLILTEVTAVQPFHTVTFGLLDGWWRAPDEDRRLPGSPLLDTHMWRGRLEDNGFREVQVLGAGAVPGLLGQHVLMATGGTEAHSAPPPVPAPPAEVSEPRTRSGADDLGALVREVVTERVAACLGIEADDVSARTPLSDLGVDSIVAVELTNRLNDALGTALKTIVVFDHPTVDDLSAYIVRREADRLGELLRPAVRPTAPATDESAPAPTTSTPLRAVRFDRPGHPRDLRIVPMEPVTPGPGQVAVQVRAFPINFSDFLFAKGLYPTMPEFPCTPGVEVSGIVREVGPGVHGFAAGDEVIALTGAQFGGQASVVVTDADFVVAKPPGVSHEQACGFPVAFLAMYLAFERAGVRRGERVLIPAATGTTGLIAIQLARLAGAEIIATAGAPHKIEYLARLGIADAIDHQRADVVAEVLRRTGGSGVDVVINTQAGPAIQQGLDVLAPEGRYVEIAVFGLQASHGFDLSRLVDNQSFHSFNTKKFFRRHPERRAEYLRIAAEYLASGKVVPTVAHTVSFEHITQAYALKEDRSLIGRVVVTMPEPETATAAATAEPASSDRDPVRDTDIAVIGMSGRFPGAPDVGAFWHNLAAGVSSIRAVPGERWSTADYYDPDPRRRGTSNCGSGGFLDDVSHFDAGFFAVPDEEAAYTDPQQRLFLEEAWRAVAEAGYSATAMRGSRCGVFVGVGPSQYLSRMTAAGITKPPQVFWGNESSVLASRIAYFLDLKGPTMAVNTACSSSLVALHLAAQSILDGECETAIAGGVFITLDPDYFVVAGSGGMLAPDGRCKTFDAAADGFGPGEAVAAVLLKPLAAALRDGDHIHGVLKGTAINQDGRTNGITAPSGSAQTAVELAAYARAEIDPATIGYVEAHGTGTRLGDAIEIDALSAAFGAHTGRTGWCAIGTAKTNIGHTAAASGIVGVIKVLLAMRHRQIPPSLNFDEPNPLIDFAQTPFVVATQLREWRTEPGIPRRAAVSSFGFSGTNAHAVLEEPPRPKGSGRTALPALATVTVPVSAHTRTALRTWCERLAQWLDGPGATTSLTELAYHLQIHRDHFTERAAFVVADLGELRTALDDPETASITAAQRDPVAASYLAGAEVDWRGGWHGQQGPRLSLPGCPLEPRRHWYAQDDRVFGSFAAGPATASANSTPAPHTAAPQADRAAAAWEAAVTAISAVLEQPRETIGADTPHSDHGIDSVRAVQIASRISAEFGVELRPTELFRFPTLRLLAGRIAELSGVTGA